MLPVTVQFIVAMLAYALNERMARRLDYLQEENRVLKEALQTATGKTRVPVTDEQRRRLATKGKALTPCGTRGLLPNRAAEHNPCVVSTARRSKVRQLAGPKIWKAAEANDIRELVLRIAHENPGWGYTIIRDALRGLKLEIGRTTVANILSEAGIEPAPERSRKRTWKQFLKSHCETLYACDFFAVETLGIFGSVRHMVFFAIELKSRAVHIAGVRVDPALPA